MANVRKLRPRIYWMLSVLIALDVAMAVYLISPFRARPQERQQHLTRAEQQLKKKQKESAPLVGMDKKLKVAQIELDRFYGQRFATSESAIATELGRLATANGVQISGASYKKDPVAEIGAQQVSIDAEMEGQYLNDVKFINALERDPMFFLLKNLQLDEQRQSGTVRIRLGVQTFLKG